MRLARACAVTVLIFSAAVAASSYTDQREAAAAILARTVFNPELRPKSFHGGEWFGPGDTYLALEPSPTPNGTDIVRYQTASGARDILVPASRLVPPGAKEPLAIESYAFSSDQRQLLLFTNSKTVWRQNTRGDYWLFNLASGALRKLGGDAPASTLMFAKFSPDNSKVAYVRASNVYSEELASGKITQLTRDGSDNVINGTSDWVNEEEFDIRDGFAWSPDGRAIAFLQFNTTGVKRYALTYDLSPPRGEIVSGFPYPGTGFYPETMLYPYPITGTQNSAVRVGVVSVPSAKVVWMQTSGDPHDFYIPRFSWAGPRHVLLQHMNRLQNKNDFLVADSGSGASHLVYSDEDKAWVDVDNDVTWINQGKEFLVLSERDGWRHLYRVAQDSGKTQLVTLGDFDVVAVERITSDEKWVYFVSSPENATQRYLFRAPLDGSAPPERLTPQQPGSHSYTISPNGEYAFHSFSSWNSPPASDVVHLPDHHVLRVTADNASLADRVKPFSDGPAEFLKLDASNGLQVDAWLAKPPNFDASKQYPLIVYVYTEPAGQTTADRWPQPFLRAITAAGYLVASFDNEGTPAPRGRDWRKVIYGNVGPLSSQQQAAALLSLQKLRSYVDPKRVGVWGWSGGGTETLNLMFRYPDLYSVGVSVASVPDQRLYDTIYQERYLGLPADNSKAYQASSAINFAAGLRGNLLVIHGSGDDNVHYQGFELLVNKLVELGKPFDMRVYPARTHGIFEGQGTSKDVYTNILGYFLEHLPPTPH